MCPSISRSVDVSCPNPSRYPPPARCLSGTNCKPWRGSHSAEAGSFQHSQQGGAGEREDKVLTGPGQHITGSITLIITGCWTPGQLSFRGRSLFQRNSGQNLGPVEGRKRQVQESCQAAEPPGQDCRWGEVGGRRQHPL